MKSLRIKFLSAIIGAILLALSSSVASASAPHVIGYVKNKDTGEGIPGMVVRWEDNADAQPNHGGSNGVRYAVTGADGQFRFASWHLPPAQGGIGTEDLREAERDTEIDTNYDGKKDTRKSSSSEGLFFGCVENPHTFTLMLPRPGFDGQFEPQKIVAELINGSGVQNIGTFNYIPTTPQCPPNVRHSCDASAGTATVTWDQSPGGADWYRLYYDRTPFHDQGAGDALHPNLTNQLSRTFNISLNTDYMVRVKTVRGGKESESCVIQFKCDNVCQPGQPGCGGTGGGCEPTDPKCKGQAPTATLTSCLVQTNPYYAYTIANINTYGQQFDFARLMLTFSMNAQGQQILNFLTNSSNSSTADFSQWNEQNRQKQTGDYFGFYIQSWTSVPSNNMLSYQIGPNTRIGQKTMAEFQQFLKQNSLSTNVAIKANMATKFNGGSFFNSHIPAPTRLDLSKGFNELCSSVTTPGSCPAISILQPQSNQVVKLVNNKVTVTWAAVGAQAGTEYEVIVFDKNAYNADPAQAYQAYVTGTSIPILMPNNLIVYTTTATSQVVDFSQIDGLNPANWMFAVRSTNTTAAGAACDWVESTPLPPGFTVTGTFYNDETCKAVNPVSLAGRKVSVKGMPGLEVTVTGNTYSILVPYTDTYHTMQLSLGNPPAEPYTCSPCNPSGNLCQKSDVTETKPVANFFVQEEKVFTNSWWQVFGGHVFARNLMNSDLPITQENTSWRLIERLVSGVAETAGIPLTNRHRFGPEAESFENVASWLSNRDPQLQAASSNINLTIKPNYSYYKNKLEVPTTQLPEVIDTLPDLQTSALDKNGVVVHYKEGNLTFTPDKTWDITGGQHHVVLVNGNITFSSQPGINTLTTVQKGSTLTFVASGKITIASNVGNADMSAGSNLEGIFIANDIEIQGGEEKRFVGEGSFIGWNTVTLGRQIPDDKNETMPAEMFIYRPDFLISLPDALRDGNVIWREVN